MSGYEAYQTYQSLKLYFKQESSYDFFKFQGKISTKLATYEKRKDKYFFEKLARKYNRKELIDFLVANIIASKLPDWVGEVFTEEAEDTYLNWKKRVESLTYVFSNDLEKLKLDLEIHGNDFNWMFQVLGGVPNLIRSYFRGEISIETLVLMNRTLNFMNHWSKFSDNLVVGDILNVIKKYDPFLKFPKTKIKSIMKEKFVPVPVEVNV